MQTLPLDLLFLLAQVKDVHRGRLNLDVTERYLRLLAQSGQREASYMIPWASLASAKDPGFMLNETIEMLFRQVTS